MKCHVDYYCKTESEKVLLMNKLDLVKVHLGQGNIHKSTNYLALCEVLDWYIFCNLDEGPQYQGPPDQGDAAAKDPTLETHLLSADQLKHEQLYIGTVSSIRKTKHSL